MYSLLILIVILLIALIALFAQFSSNYYTQVKVMRRFFKNKGTAPENYMERTSLQKEIDYGSVFPRGVLDLYTSNEVSAPQPLLVWVHGGGYVGGDKSCCEPWARIIAAEKHVAVASINYCLAPEQHYPVPILQLNEALGYLTANAQRYAIDPERVFIAGDSAGAQITAQFASVVCNRTLRDDMKIIPAISKATLRGIILCCGFYNMDTVLKSHFPAIKTFFWAYTNSKKPKNFPKADEMSTVKHIDEDFCHTFVTCGDADPFIGQAKELVAALEKNSVEHTAYLPKVSGKKLGHEYQFLIGTVEANEALREAMEFIEKNLG